ncbi:MAG: hypothetical protein PHH54_03835 [Candidatus Nanoarchaeia archaeon]|nr:hypothetical protein [Candidatus Nanoarchaeia archaeon]MDD5741090.1 hypothetical protein [Candidatus Nanoarchaeia archaeon]
MKKEKLNCYENYPKWMVFVSNLLNILIYAIGFYIILGFGLAYSVIYLLYVGFLEVKVLKKSCVNCYYYGKRCCFGKGKLAPLFFKKRDNKFSKHEMSWKYLIPDMLVSVIPIIAGIALLIIDFSWLILILILILAVLTSFGNGFVRGQLACKYCKQRELGCPAEKLFNKNKKSGK